MVGATLGRGDVVDYTMGSRLIRVLVVSANAYTRNYPVIALIHNRADVDVPAGGGNGTVIAQGGRFGGWSLYVINGVPGYEYNFLGLQHTSVTSNKTFPKNVEVEALLTYSPNDRENLGLPSVPDIRFVPVSVHYSFLELPETPHLARFADDRVGYFIDTWKDMSHDYKDDYWVRAINRWKLEKKDPTAAVSEPVEPIVFWIENTTPMELRPTIEAAALRWNEAAVEGGARA